jgi:hypothetical protein
MRLVVAAAIYGAARDVTMTVSFIRLASLSTPMFYLHEHVDLPEYPCPSDMVFVRAVYMCVFPFEAEAPLFQDSLNANKVCPGGTFTSVPSVQRLRYCNTITSSIILANISEDIDPMIFWDIRSIAGAVTACSYHD